MRILLAFLLLFSETVCAQNWKEFRFESGDLLFQDYDCGEVCEALHAVSPAYEGKRFTHAALVYRVQDAVWIIEAFDKDVHLTSLSDFMKRSVDGKGNPKVSVGRVSSDYQSLAGRAVGFALEKRGIPYDHDYTYDNGKYFGSELVFDAYKAAHYGKALFDPGSMSFRDPVSGKLNGTWERYFGEIGTTVPEGKSAPSAAALAGDDNVEIIVSFY